MYDIITVGGSTFDIFLKLDRKSSCLMKKKFSGKPVKSFLCFDFGGKIAINEIHECVGGGANNTSVSFSRLGMKSAICSIIGNDKYADTIRKNLKKEKVSSRFLLKLKTIETGFSIILSTHTGERTVLYFRGANNNFSSAVFPAKKISKNTKAIFLNRVSMHGETVLKELLWIQKYNPHIFFAWNPGGNQLKSGVNKYKDILSYTNILFLNKEEAVEFSRTPKELDKNKRINYNQQPFNRYLKNLGRDNIILKKIFNILKDYGVEISVITDGVNGAFACQNKIIYWCPIINKKKIDTLGAGDSFSSAFTYAVLNGYPIPEALKYGTCNSYSVVNYFGAQKGLLKKNAIEKMTKTCRLKVKSYKL